MQTGSVLLRVVATLAAGVVVGGGVVMLARAPTPPPTDGGPTPAAGSPGPTASPSVDAEQLAAAHAYLGVIRPIAHDAGRVVQEGMKPAITVLLEPDGDHERQAQGALGWLAAMEAARQEWAVTTPPPALHDAHDLFLDALDTYIDAADRLARAANVDDDDRRATLVEETIDLGTHGDDLYDRAAWIVQGHLMAGGEDPVTWLPQPPQPPPSPQPTPSPDASGA